MRGQQQQDEHQNFPLPIILFNGWQWLINDTTVKIKYVYNDFSYLTKQNKCQSFHQNTPCNVSNIKIIIN